MFGMKHETNLVIPSSSQISMFCWLLSSDKRPDQEQAIGINIHNPLRSLNDANRIRND